MELGQSQNLPTIRQNLRLLSASADEDGEPRWQLFDPVANQFFYLSRSGFYLFRYWRKATTAEELLAILERQQLELHGEDIEYFTRFLVLNHLVQIQEPQGVAQLQQEQSARKKHWLMWLLHNYLFIKIPLFRPDLALNRWYQRLRWLFTLPMGWIMGCIGVLGLFLVSRQWDTFTHTFQNFLSLDGMVYYFLALVVVKTCHEMGHALTAKRYGCRVSSMGVAFLLMTPILYTDTTDAWRLRSRWQRLDIVTAGVRVEIYIACVATLLWALVPDGQLRSVFFFVATTSWISSLLINVSPFMRFDGYYALSDFLGMENLQPRAFQVGRWFLRELLFDLQLPAPEPLNRRKLWLMVSYAWGTWIYRLFLFLGIALLVYYFAFKVLGIVLFLVEIIWFVLLPIIKEVAMWLRLRQAFKLNRRLVLTGALLLSLITLVLVPWKSTVTIPAILTSTQQHYVFSPEPARIEVINVSPGQTVAAGEILFILQSDELEFSIQTTNQQIEQLSRQWQRAAAGAGENESLDLLQAALVREQSRMQSLLERRERLVVKASFAGQIGALDDLRVGDYVSEKRPLASVFDGNNLELRAFIPATDMSNMDWQQKGLFVPDRDAGFALEVSFLRQQPSATTQLNDPELASIYGGPIDVQQSGDKLVPVNALYEVRFSPVTPEFVLQQEMLGSVRLYQHPQSMISRWLTQVYSVFIRESGF